MFEEEKGLFVRSLAGHDKGMYYIVMDSDENYLYLADGAGRTVEHRKKKKRKHLQRIRRANAEIREKILTGKPVYDAEIKHAIHLYVSEIKEDGLCQSQM